MDLCCHVQYRPSVGHYHNYGAAMSEVEIDLLTGEVQVVAAHVLYDCGRSLNPAIDLGQVCFSDKPKGLILKMVEQICVGAACRSDFLPPPCDPQTSLSPPSPQNKTWMYRWRGPSCRAWATT